jgi:hypothetical protein
MAAGVAAKLLIVGAGGGGEDDPPQPARPPKPRLRTRTHAAGARALFTAFFLCAKDLSVDLKDHYIVESAKFSGRLMDDQQF